MRLTPDFDAAAVPELLEAVVHDVDAAHPAMAPASVCEAQNWPPYRLRDHAPIVQAMLAAARDHHKPEITPVVCGPSNIGNYFAAHEIDATCGFGVAYENLHAPNERIKLDTIQFPSLATHSSKSWARRGPPSLKPSPRFTSRITLSVDGRKLRKTSLWHFSSWKIITEAIVQSR
jgi:hypothetical protein